jgi:REP element-mobilizing transposase RayT
MHPFPARPPRLKEVFPNFDPPLYFVTFCTWRRARILASEAVHAAFIDYAKQNLLRGIHTGRYVLMPDHVHLFVSLPGSLHLEHYVRLLKQYLHRTLRRDSESSRLWQNPVRAGLVERTQDWPYQGEIERIDVM